MEIKKIKRHYYTTDWIKNNENNENQQTTQINKFMIMNETKKSMKKTQH